MYSRFDPYLLVSGLLHHTVPVRYVKIDSSHLLISLLKANLHYKIIPTNISIDTMDKETALEAFRTVDIPENHLTLHMVTARPGQDKFVNKTLEQHIVHHANGALLCVTNITDVYHSLHELGIPAAIINPTTESFVHEIRNLMLRHRLENQKLNPMAVIHMKLRYKEKYQFYGEIPIREIDELSNAAKLIAVFADKVGGAMCCLNRWDYTITCSWLLLQEVTKQFEGIDLMEDVNRDTVFDIALGIGCGQTAGEAQTNALLAANRAAAQRGTTMMVAFGPGNLLGPVSPKSKHLPENSLTEGRLEEICDATGLGMTTINEIYQATLKQNTNLFTASQLARLLGVTTRTVNRYLEKFLDGRCATIAGKDLGNPQGRPARVFRLLF